MVDSVVVSCWVVILVVTILIIYGKIPLYTPSDSSRVYAEIGIESQANVRVVNENDKIDPAPFEIGELAPESQNVASACTDKKIDPTKDCYKQLYPINPIYVDYSKDVLPTFTPMPCTFN